MSLDLDLLVEFTVVISSVNSSSSLSTMSFPSLAQDDLPHSPVVDLSICISTTPGVNAEPFQFFFLTALAQSTFPFEALIPQLPQMSVPWSPVPGAFHIL